MEYSKTFENEAYNCEKIGIYLGTGNPNSKILIIGKETAIDTENRANRDELYVRFQNESQEAFEQNASKWNFNVKNLVDADSLPNWIGGIDSPLSSNPLFPFKSLPTNKLKEGHTWKKYQKLHDLLIHNDIAYSKEKEFDFHRNSFLTEINSASAKYTKYADKSSVPVRKQFLKESKFIQCFPIVILACSNYINGKEICDIFNVTFERQGGKDKQLFWTHYNSDRTKLVIHTRQLSANVSDDLLREMANEIYRFRSEKWIQFI